MCLILSRVPLIKWSESRNIGLFTNRVKFSHVRFKGIQYFNISELSDNLINQSRTNGSVDDFSLFSDRRCFVHQKLPLYPGIPIRSNIINATIFLYRLTMFCNNHVLGLLAPLSSATCSMKGRNLPLKVITTLFSPCLPIVVPTSQ